MPVVKYLTTFTIDVRRVDNKMLTPEENAMVEQMRQATHDAIAKIMAQHGQQTLAKQDRTDIY